MKEGIEWIQENLSHAICQKRKCEEVDVEQAHRRKEQKLVEIIG